MRKFFLGLIVGVAISTVSSVYADDIVQSVVGKKIDGEFNVKIAGITLEAKAAVLEGTSYVPVRAIGEALNMDVKFDSTTGIELTRKGATTLPSTFTEADKEALRLRIEANNKLLELNKKRKEITDEIPQYSNVVRSADHRKLSEENYQYDDAYYVAKKAWEDKQSELAELDKQIADLQIQLQQ